MTATPTNTGIATDTPTLALPTGTPRIIFEQWRQTVFQQWRKRVYEMFRQLVYETP